MKESSDAAKRGTRQTLVRVLESILRLTHPIMPYITEELWQRVAPLAGVQAETIMTCAYPEHQADRLDPDAEAELEWVKTFVMGVRRIRSEMDIAPGKPLPVLLQNASELDKQRIASNEAFLHSLARLENTTLLGDDEQAPESATALVGEMKLLIPLAGLIDKDAELARLNREIAKIDGNLQKSLAKLNNPSFADKAPEAVVLKEQNRVAEMQHAIAQLQEQLDKISAL